MLCSNDIQTLPGNIFQLLLGTSGNNTLYISHTCNMLDEIFRVIYNSLPGN
jgi:hypothetical protein